MVDLKNKIYNAVQKFNLDLTGKTVLTEAATGNYVVTPLIAAVAGAKKVYAFTKDSKYGSIDDVQQQTHQLALFLDIDDRVEIITDLNQIDLFEIDILTNTGFLRPITESLIKKLPSSCVIPLMWETWEFRDQDIDLESCFKHQIKVYGTNEDDPRLRTKEYIGYMGLSFLLQLKHTPFSSNILVLGCRYFTDYIEKVLHQNHYQFTIINDYNHSINVDSFDTILILEHHDNQLIIGSDNAYIHLNQISADTDVIHICGNVDFSGASFNHIPNKPAPFGYMSFTADYMSNQVVIDLHTAGLKVSEGMLVANSHNFTGKNYKKFMEENYPAMSFADERYW